MRAKVLSLTSCAYYMETSIYRATFSENTTPFSNPVTVTSPRKATICNSTSNADLYIAINIMSIFGFRDQQETNVYYITDPVVNHTHYEYAFQTVRIHCEGSTGWYNWQLQKCDSPDNAVGIGYYVGQLETPPTKEPPPICD